MSCCQQIICRAGKAYMAYLTWNVNGTLRTGQVFDHLGTFGPANQMADITTIGTYTIGACPIGGKHTFRTAQALPAGTTVITHNLNMPGPVMVEVRDSVTGSLITTRVPIAAQLPNTVAIVVTVAEPNAVITIVAVE
jgi:hypothetical protein